jgi:hypothetical protein
MMEYAIIYKIMNIGNRIVYNIDIANISKPSNELSILASVDIRAHIINKITDPIWMNVIDDIRNEIRLNLTPLWI